MLGGLRGSVVSHVSNQHSSEQASSSSAAAIELDVEGLARSLLVSLRLMERNVDNFKAAIHASLQTGSINRLNTPQDVARMAKQLEAGARDIAAAVESDADGAGNARSGPNGHMPERARDMKRAAQIAAAKPAVALTAGLRIYAMQTAGAGSGAGAGSW